MIKSLPGILFVCVSSISVANPIAQELDCLIEPHRLIEVSSHLEATVEKVHVDKGDVVKKGQSLAQLESSVEQATVMLAKAKAQMEHDIHIKATNMKLAEQKYKRINELYGKNAAALDDLDEAQANFALAKYEFAQAKENKIVAELELDRAKRALARRNIKSPIDGVVVERKLSAGETVKDKLIVKIAQTHPLRIDVIVPAEYFGTIKKGMRAEISPEINRYGKHAAQVYLVDKVIDPSSGTFDVRLTLNNPGNLIPSGQKCRLSFVKPPSVKEKREKIVFSH